MFKETVAIPDTRYAHFDIAAKVATIEIEGLDTGLRFDDIKDVFESHRSFSPTSAVANRIRAALDLLHNAFKDNGAGVCLPRLPNTYEASLCQSAITHSRARAE